MLDPNTKFYILAFLLGILCKVYDDIYDNNLYEVFGIKSEIKPYFNHILKSTFIIGFTVLSLNSPMFLIFSYLTNALCFYNCKDDYPPYEFSVFFAPIIILPFLNWATFSLTYWHVLFFFNTILFCYIVEKSCNMDKNKEYSRRKLLTRFVMLLATCCALFVLEHVPHFLILIMGFSIGYLAVSCITQVALVYDLIDRPSQEVVALSSSPLRSPKKVLGSESGVDSEKSD